MKIIVPGYRYQVDMMEGGYQFIQFIHKDVVDGKFVTIHNGTTNEEILEVLINRLEFLDAKLPDMENKDAIGYLNDALRALNRRTKDRIRRGIEGTPAR